MVTNMTKDTNWHTLCHLVSSPLKDILCHLVSCGGTKWHNYTKWYMYATKWLRPLSVLTKVREGRRTAHLPKLFGFLDYTAISEHI